MDQLSDAFLQINIGNDPELVLQYKMLAFVYNKDYLKRVQFTSVWQEFLVKYPHITYTSMELKLEFCLRILADVDKFKHLSPAQITYFKSRIFNQNADELLRHCDLERGVHFMTAEESPVIVPFEMQHRLLSAENVNLFGRQCPTGPIPVRGTKAKKGTDRSLIELLGSVFQTPSERGAKVQLSANEVQNRIRAGIRQKVDFKGFLQQHFRTVEGTVDTPEASSVVAVAASSHYTPTSPVPENVSSTLDQTAGPSHPEATSTPLIGHVARPVTRAISQQDGRSRHRSKSPRRAVSADRSGESLRRFGERLKARSKPRRLPRN